MSSDLVELCFDANDPVRICRFWAGVLGRDLSADSQEGVTLVPDGGTGFQIRFLHTGVTKTRPNQIHFDMTSTSLEDQRAIVARALELGARHLDIGQGLDADHVVLADPEGNEFCVIPPGNNFLADTAPIGALSSDGTQRVGYFWSAALGWPLVWDQDEETAIQSAHGGTKISWGGPPVRPKVAKNRLHLNLAPLAPAGTDSEIDRLISLGAARSSAGQCGEGWVAMTDPDGNEFCVRATIPA